MIFQKSNKFSVNFIQLICHQQIILTYAKSQKKTFTVVILYEQNFYFDKELFAEKTGNEWGAAEMVKKPNKFFPLEIDYGQVGLLFSLHSLFINLLTEFERR